MATKTACTDTISEGKGGIMFATKPLQFLIVTLMFASLFFVPSWARAHQNQVMGELRFSGPTKVERDSGVWIDGQYVGGNGGLCFD